MRLPCLLAGFLFLLGVLACAGDPPPPPPREGPRECAPASGDIHLAGTGAMTPLLAKLGEEWEGQGGRPRVIVEESIGSGGGIRAAADCAVDLGMVSRPLSGQERSLPLMTIPVGTDIVVLAAHPSVPLDGITKEQLLALYRGEESQFPGGGTAVPLLRDRVESANAALEKEIPQMHEVRELAYKQRRLRVLYHDRAMAEAIAATPGAIGVFSLGMLETLRIPLKVLAIDGVRPSLASFSSGHWRAGRELFMVARKERLQHAEPFLQFIASPHGRARIRAYGYLPHGESAP
jgi:phosphate transport system substrate-binding protein